jgi:putative transposase
MTSFWLPCCITWVYPIVASPQQWKTHSLTNLSGCGIGRLDQISLHPDRIERHVIAVDETKLKIAGNQVFVWSAIDVERYEVLGLKASATRGELDAILFLKDILQYCDGGERPIILVDHGPWYPPALEHLGLRYKQVTFQNRNVIESWFHILKQKTKRFYNDFPFHSTMQSVASYLSSFMRMQNILTASEIT